MAQLKDSAYLPPTGDRIAIPDVSDMAQVVVAAHHVWMLVNENLSADADDCTYAGISGKQWRGKLNAVINALWPELLGGYIVKRSEADHIRKVIHAYLKSSRTMVCINRGGGAVIPTWWVNERWAPVTFSRKPVAVAAVSEDVLPSSQDASMLAASQEQVDPMVPQDCIKAIRGLLDRLEAAGCEETVTVEKTDTDGDDQVQKLKRQNKLLAQQNAKMEKDLKSVTRERDRLMEQLRQIHGMIDVPDRPQS